MATLRTMHKRRKRKLMIAAQPCQHQTVRDYPDGFYCVWCGVSWNTELWGRAFWDDGDNDERTPWCCECDEPEWSCVCGEPIDLDELPPEAFMEYEEPGGGMKRTPPTQCPICKMEIDEYAECRTAMPFTARDPIEGLNAWSAFDVPKETVCHREGGEYIHFRTPGEDRPLERLVYMTEAVNER